jgi:2-C-methyl-D-erythritol 4-phosphate cytidylyltransferase / 2-C-methyl-D-erythritol 2,4-cyclodiphosphate synthase
VTALRCGGATRAASVANALSTLADRCRDDDWMLVHDAARPCVPLDALTRLMEHLRDDPVGGILAIPVADTLKRDDREADAPRILATEPRAHLWQAQTPQMFRFGVLRRAFASPAAGLHGRGAGRGSAWPQASTRSRQPGESQDHLSGRPDARGGYPCGAMEGGRDTMTMRIGTGYDVHALVAARPLVIGGVTIPHPRGLAGHSDADVLLHAITDALLGALALGDLGAHFPDSDPRYKGADSRTLLRHVAGLVRTAGWELGNLDATVIAQAPRLAPHVQTMRANIAADLGVEPALISVKATTTERLGFAGREEGIAAEAVVLLRQSEAMTP